MFELCSYIGEVAMPLLHKGDYISLKSYKLYVITYKWVVLGAILDRSTSEARHDILEEVGDGLN